MVETITLTFTKNIPSFSLALVSPTQLPIKMSEAIKGVSGADLSNPEDIEGFPTDPTFYYILAAS